MKKIVILFVFCAFVALANAKVGYLLRTSTVEGLSTGEQYNERAAAEWFYTTYVKTGKGDFIAMNAIPASTSTYTAIWINIDDNGSGALPSEFTADVKIAIGNFVKAGGNLLLTKRAARVLCEIGRMKKNDNSQYEPSEEWRDACRQFVNAKIAPSIQLRDASHHPIFQDVSVFNSEEGHFLLSSSVSDPDKGYIWTEMYRKDGGKSDNGNIANLNDFQSNWSCQVLAVWGSVADYIAPVIVEFYPQGDDYKGTILSIGTASYKWGTANTNIDNVKTLTSNALNYLSAGGTQYGYYMPYALSELYSTDTYHADYQTAKWFYDNYVVTNKGRFIHKGETFPEGMTVLWVNNDRVGQESDALYTAFGGNDFRDALSAFVVSGGNVFLSKQATRFIGDIGRVKWRPSYGVSKEQKDDETWYMVDNFVAVTIGTPGGSGVSLHDHPVYATLRATKANQYTKHIWGPSNEHDEGYCKWPLFAGEGNRTKMTYIWGEPTSVWSESYDMSSETRTTEYATVTSFENNAGMQCKILGGWGHTTALDAVGFAEFPPATIDENTVNEKKFDGSVICIGLPAYQWSVENTCIGNVRALTQGILDYLGGVVVVTEPETNLTNTTVNDLVVYQGGSVSNEGDITINNSITYVRPAVGGTAGNALGSWYTFCLPFTPSAVKVLDEDDGFDYDIQSVYLTGSDADTNEPEGSGHFYLQTFDNYDGEDTHWAYIGNSGVPTKDIPYIIKFIDAAEDSEKGDPGLASYFTSNPVIKFIGGAQTIYDNEDGTSGLATGDFSFHVNKTLRKLTLSGIYPLNIETNMFEYDYGDESTIMPFECYIKASSPSVANACPRIMIGRRISEETNTATSIENLTAQTNSPILVYDLMGRLCFEGMPSSLPQGLWIIRQGQTTRTIVVP